MSQIDSEYISYLDYPEHTSREDLASYLCHRVLQADQSGQAYVLVLPQQVIGSGPAQRLRSLTALGLW